MMKVAPEWRLLASDAREDGDGAEVAGHARTPWRASSTASALKKAPSLALRPHPLRERAARARSARPRPRGFSPRSCLRCGRPYRTKQNLRGLRARESPARALHASTSP